MRHRNPWVSVKSDTADQRFNFIKDFGRDMAGKQGCRVRQLSKDTANGIHCTCMVLVALTRYLLEVKQYNYVCLGKFSTDPLEKAFSKFRQSSGGTYFINAQQVIENYRFG